MNVLSEISRVATYAYSNLSGQMWGAFAGFLLGISVNIAKNLAKSLTQRVRHYLTGKKVDYIENKNGAIKILEYGPSILVGHDAIKSVKQNFFLPFPPGKALEISKDSSFTGVLKTDPDIFGSKDIGALANILEIDNLPELIQPHIEDISNQFLNRDFGISFNSTLYGVRTFKRVRHGLAEQPCLHITCYETDYFTFKVMDAFHRNLLTIDKSKSLRSFSADQDINNRLYPFLTSIGLNFLIISSDERIIITKRSENLDRFGITGSPIYPSFNEALASHDIPRQSGLRRVPSIPLCYQRGLIEELGLFEFESDPPTYRLIGFGDVGIGFGVYGYSRSPLVAREITSRLSGQDRGFESSEVFSVPLNRRSVNKILKNKLTSLQVSALLRAMKVDFSI